MASSLIPIPPYDKYKAYLKLLPATISSFFARKYDIQFLASETYNKFLKNIAYGMVGKKIKICFLNSTNDDLGYSDGMKIYINKFHKMFRDLPLYCVIMCNIALIVHEVSHIQNTNFQCVRQSAQAEGKETPIEVSIKKDLFNLLEDSRIERISSFDFPGYASSLYLLNKVIYDEQENAVKQNNNDGEIFYNIRALMWEYALLGVEGTSLIKEAKAYWEKVKPIVKKARREDICSLCYEDTKEIMKILKPILPNNYTEMPKMSAASNYPNNEDVDANTNGFDDRNEDASGGNSNDSNKPDENNTQNSTESKNSENSEPDKSETNNSKSSSSGSSEKSEHSDSNGGNEKSEKTDTEKDDSEPNKNHEQSVSEEQSFSELLKGIEESLSQLNQVEEEYKEEEKRKKVDEETNQKNTEKTRTQGVKINYVGYREEDTERYQEILDVCRPVCTNFKVRLKKILKYNEDEMIRRIGRGRVDGKSLTNMANGKVCCKRKDKSEESDLNFTILLDASGSMRQCNRIGSTIAATTVFQETAKSLKIPISVMSFSGGSHRNCDIDIFSHFKHKSDSMKRIVRFNPEGGTPLAEGVEYLLKFINTVPQKDKVVIVITDGAPNNSALASKMIDKLKKKAVVYGLAIGDGYESLSKLFGKNYLEIQNLNELPKAMCKVLEKNLLKGD